MDASNIYGMVETAILFKSKYLKLIEIPQYQDERFLSEEILYIQLDKFGKFCTRNQAFYISEYQSDGLTAHIFQLWKKNPKGIPSPKTKATRTIIILFGESGFEGPLGLISTLVFPTLTRAANSFSSLF